MTIENEENEPKNSRPLRIKIVDDENSEHFHNPETDKTAQDAEVISETRYVKAEREETGNEYLSDFLAGLPSQADTKFIVARLPDNNLTGKFRLRCDQEEQCDPVYWNGCTEPSPIYTQIRKINGGGVYRIRTHNKTGFVKNGTWVETLSDPPEESAKEKILREREETRQSANQPTPAINQPEHAQQTAQPTYDRKQLLADIIEEKKLEAELGALFAPPQTQTTVSVQNRPKTEKEEQATFLMDLYKETQESDLKKKLLNKFIGVEDKNEPPAAPWYERAVDRVIDAVSASEQLQTQGMALIGGVVQVVSAIAVNKLTSPPATPPATGAPAPPAAPPPDLDALQQPRNDAPAAPPPENAPQAQTPRLIPVDDFIPTIKL